MSCNVKGHELEAVYRTYYVLDNDCNRLFDKATNTYTATNEEFDELRCILCGDYFETLGRAENSSACKQVM